ncbi:STAS/SEC14 domain-containing protein [Cocleimonas sp. KMM 6892]|uniref:STAS/SEC14 domain-containing protein n=1 Tax=unclassified Cocleimonas TaxID=2639732 RepID=UPI002DB82C69|nr:MULTISPECIES: STAS/SEC14 domain-containing protein [unclassified Cocleimonas]MEB8434389.1 STAS/SEC14 domain-containing protein [Cocleimonas sp. KMM 6892]MEC4717208.1 STAS/SEC14 domain-containing protein [Cocleimonas sp. KMM 6895]MEC4746587.1 STAS/SEC14 domain-containing protein [Cocleimonas sp. KMM 6896]
MLQIIPVYEGNTIAVRASGKLSHEDYQKFIPELEKHIKEHEKITLLFEFDNFTGWDLDAVKDDFKFGMKHLENFERIAMVGDKAWERWMSFIAKPFLISGEVKYFNRENLQDAWDWLREREDLEKLAEQIQPYKNIVVAVDYSAYAKHACKRAIELAKHYKASLTLLNVALEYVPYSAYGDAMGAYLIDEAIIEEQNQARMEASEAQMKAFTRELDTDYPIISKVICGETKSGIVTFLEAQDADLVVFGARKKKGLNKLIGTIPQYVQSNSRCEMLIVPLQDLTF